MSDFLSEGGVHGDDHFLSTDAEVDSEVARSEVYILSDAGKPVYWNKGSVEEFVTLAPVIQTIVSHFQVAKEEIQYIQTNESVIGFLSKRCVTLMIVSSVVTPKNVKIWLQLLHDLLISISMPSIESANSQFPGEILLGVQHLLNCYIRNLEFSCFMSFQTIKYYPVRKKLRKNINKILDEYHNENIVLQFLLINNGILAFYVSPGATIHLSDYYILLNLATSKQFDSDSGSWVPIKLPHLNEKQFFHCYISYLPGIKLQDGSKIMFISVATSCGIVETVSTYRTGISEAISKIQTREIWKEAVYFELAFRSKFEGIHHYICIYNHNVCSQYVAAEFSPFYTTGDEIIRLKLHYERIYAILNDKGTATERYFSSGKHEIVCGLRNNYFTLLTSMDLLLTNDDAISTLKMAEDFFMMELKNIFIRKPPNFVSRD